MENLPLGVVWYFTVDYSNLLTFTVDYSNLLTFTVDDCNLLTFTVDYCNLLTHATKVLLVGLEDCKSIRRSPNLKDFGALLQ